MTAVPAQPGPRGGGFQPPNLTHTDRMEWFTAAEACQLLGKSRGQVNRLCQQQWGPRGLAEKRATAWGPQAWHIASTAHPRLRRAFIERTDDGRSSVTQLLTSTIGVKRTEAETRAMMTIAYRKWRMRDDIVVARDWPAFEARMIEQHGYCLSKRRMQTMDQLCPTSDDFAGCVAALIDRRGRPSATSTVCSDGAWSRFAALYLHPNQWSLAKCWRTVRAEAEEHGWAWPARRTVEKLIKQRLTPEMICLKREGAEAWRRAYETPIGQDPNAWAPGQCWEGDHSQLDFFIRVFRGGKWQHSRAWLTAWIDRRTRRLMGWVISHGGTAATIRQALLVGLRSDGVSVPDAVWIDNGKDYAAASIAGYTKTERRKLTPDQRREADREACGILQHLGIEAHFAQPYNHNGKARIERFFGTVHGEFDKEFSSYAGYCSGLLDKKERANRLKNVMALPTIDEVRERFAAWAEWFNARSEHAIDDLVDEQTGERLSPDEYYQRHLPSRRVVREDSLMLLEQVFTRPLKVHKWGISLKIGNKTVRYGEHAPQLRELIGSGRQVRVSFDESDLRTVRIYDEDFRLICIANENGRHGGLSDDPIRKADVQAAHTARRQLKRDLKRKLDLTAASLSDAELTSKMARDREVEATKARLAEQRGQADPGETPPLRLVQTPVDTNDAEAIAMQQAAGAEVWPDDEPSVIDLLAEQHQEDESTDTESEPMGSLLDSYDDADDGEVEGPSVLTLLANQAEDL